ncbi:MAG: hypothetical protein QG635_2268 [Bacteroidota bacterium]|nr:hypothetical protein [Bacteroidota bacterium]
MKNIQFDRKEIIRKLAEERYNAIDLNYDSLVLENDRRKVFYELQVHQIELEMQNEELRKTQLELDEAREKYFKMYNLAPIGYISLSDKGLITEANMTVTNLFGVDKINLINKPLSQFILPDDQDIYYLYFRKLILTEEKQQFELRMKNKAQESLWIEFTGITYRRYDGTIICNATIRDMTKWKLAEEEIHRKNIELAELNASKDKFFSIIAHDLRSPFNGFLGLTRIIFENFHNFSLNELLDIIKSMKLSAGNLYQLLENLLEWSSMQRGISDFLPVTCNIKFMIERNIAISGDTVKQKVIKIENNIDEELKVTADERILNSVIRNLISNAVKFTPNGGKIEIGLLKKLSDNLKPSDNPNNCIIFIKDSGIGMTEEILSKLFKIDQKVTRQGTENEPSTGLGLLLCKEFIERHGGMIWVESEVGRGTAFYFSIPIAT